MCIVTNLCSLINWRRYIEEIRIGVALATLISQLLSAISITIYSKLRYKDIFLFRFKEYVIDTSLLKISIPYAVSSALQQVVLYVGKYIISTQINKYGEIIIDAFASATKIDDFVFTPAQNFAAATSIFFSQNYGTNKIKRAKKRIYVWFSTKYDLWCFYKYHHFCNQKTSIKYFRFI